MLVEVMLSFLLAMQLGLLILVARRDPSFVQEDQGQILIV